MRFFKKTNKTTKPNVTDSGSGARKTVETPLELETLASHESDTKSQDLAKLQEQWDTMAAEVDAKFNASQNANNSDQAADTHPADHDDAAEFLQNSTSDYQDPVFSANLGPRSERIDVTPVSDSAEHHSDSRSQDHSALAASIKSEREAISNDDITIPSAYTRNEGADLNAMRLDVARISADIQSGEELYRRAQKRIDNLTDFVERAEVDFSMLNRLEPENRRLKARNRTLEAEIVDKLRKVQILEADLENHQKRLSERNAVFDDIQAKLALATNSLREYERTLKSTRETSDRNALAAERAETALDVEKRESDILRQKMVELTVSYEEKQSGYIEAKKMADSLAVDTQEFRETAQVAQTENIELRNALDHAKLQNNQMKSEMVSLHEEIRNFKTQYEFNMIAREDEITSMQGKIDQLQKQLDVKDEIVRNAARDVTELRKIRTAQDLERERLESTITQQAYELDKSRSELLKTKQDVTDFDRRYRDVATALSVAQTIRSSSAPAATPDIQPAPAYDEGDPFMPAADRDTSHLDEQDVLSDDDIMDQITEFKLGLRNDIG